MPYATQQDMIDRYGDDDLIVSADHDGDGNGHGRQVFCRN